MEEQRSGAIGDLLDRAAEALRRLPVPPGPPAETVRRVLDAGLQVPIVPLSVREKAERTGRQFAASRRSRLPRRFLPRRRCSSPGW